MSTDSTVREVFTDVDPDPDGVLEEFGVEAPEDLVLEAEADDHERSGGAHDPTTDAALDADDATAAELFGDLAGVSGSLEAGSSSASAREERFEAARLEAGSDEDGRSEPKRDAGRASADGDDAIDADVFVSEPTVTVERDTGGPVATPAPDDEHPPDTRETDGFTLVGRPPEPVRIASDAFGGAEFE